MKSFARYCLARFEHDAQSKAYRVYMTDALKCIAENTAAPVGGAFLRVRYADILAPKPEDERTADEIKDDILNKLGR